MNTQSDITLVDETGSTNADMAAAIRAAERSGEDQWIVARRQNAGKGRQGREWFDGSGNFMGSTLVEIRDSDPPPATLSFVAALAVGQAIELTLKGACRPMLKWPNDVQLDDGKVSGILLEMVDGHVVIGIGVNLSAAPTLEGRKTAALSDFAPAPQLERFIEVLAEVFAGYLRGWREKGLIPVLQSFLQNSVHYTGSPVTVHDSDGSVIEGTFAGLEQEDGALRLRLADGSERVIRAGDIT